MTSIQGYEELFRLGADRDDVDLDVILRRIESESDRMRELDENLLILARLDEAEEVAPVREPVDLAVLAADACSDAAPVRPDRPIEFDAPTPVPVQGDPHHLRQAIANLVTNALEHTAPGSAIAVAAHLDDTAATVRAGSVAALRGPPSRVRQRGGHTNEGDDTDAHRIRPCGHTAAA